MTRINRARRVLIAFGLATALSACTATVTSTGHATQSVAGADESMTSDAPTSSAHDQSGTTTSVLVTPSTAQPPSFTKSPVTPNPTFVTKPSPGSGRSVCELSIAVNPWAGSRANAYVLGAVAATRLGCAVRYHELDVPQSWAAMASGGVDAVLEDWGDPDLVDKYIVQNHAVQRAGPLGITGVTGWFVPKWLAKTHPDIVRWENLNKYYKQFVTSESSGLGEVAQADTGRLVRDQALVKNLNLKYKVVAIDDEQTLINRLRQATSNDQWFLAGFSHPHWLQDELKLVQVQMPPYSDDPSICPTSPSAAQCDDPPRPLQKLVSTRFVDSGSSALGLVQKFQWSEEDQNRVARWIADDHMDPAAAAQQFVDDNPALVAVWLKGS